VRRKPTLILAFLTIFFLVAHRLPAPIQETHESPTPAARPSAKPKPKSAPTPKPKPTPMSFAGTWSGTTTESYFGQTSNLTIIVSKDERTVRMLAGGYDVSYPCYRAGNALHLVYKLPIGEGTTSLQLNADGQSLIFNQRVSASGETVNSSGRLMKQR
jgi:hypothetical protein